MAIKPEIGFLISFLGDGVSNSVIFSLFAAPILLQMSSFSSGAVPTAEFDIADFPTGANSLASSDGQAPTVALDPLLKTMKVDWPKAPAADQKVDITGYFEF